nr:HDA1/RPD3-4 [Neoporphyra haitanensis]
MIYHPDYTVTPWPPHHRFVMSKFADTAAHLTATGLVPATHWTRPSAPPRSALLAVHDAAYVDAFLSGTLSPTAERRIGFRGLWSPALVQRTVLEVGGTATTAAAALTAGLACHVGGGTHHAHPGWGSGFTILNDLAVTARALVAPGGGGVDRLLIVDADVHQGDGTAAVFAAPDGTDDDAYLATLAGVLPPILAAFRPELVLYDAGVDVAAVDALGRLCLTDAGIYARDVAVMEAALGAGAPVATVIGGGYAARRTALAARHAIVFRAAVDVWRRLGVGGMRW